MKLSDLRTLIRTLVPSANKNAVKDTLLDLLINKGVREVNNATFAYPGEEYFDIQENINTYDIRDDISDFVGIGPGGLWMNKGSASSPNWTQLSGVTRAFLDKKYPNWPNASSGTPLFYFVKAGEIVVYPANVSDFSDGFWLPDYLKKPTDMTDYRLCPVAFKTFCWGRPERNYRKAGV